MLDAFYTVDYNILLRMLEQVFTQRPCIKLAWLLSIWEQPKGPSIVDQYLYHSRGKNSGDHFAIQVTLDCVKLQHSKKEITNLLIKWDVREGITLISFVCNL